MDTCCCPPGVRVPPGGLKVVPGTSLLAVQSIFPVDFASSVKVTVHGPDAPQVFESKLLGLTDQSRVVVGDGDGDGDGLTVGSGVGVGSAEGTGVSLQLHDTLTGLAPPVKVK